MREYSKPSICADVKPGAADLALALHFQVKAGRRSRAYNEASGRAREQEVNTEGARTWTEKACCVEAAKIELLHRAGKIDSKTRKRTLRALQAKHVQNGRRTPAQTVWKALDLDNNGELRRLYRSVGDLLSSCGIEVDALLHFKRCRAKARGALPVGGIWDLPRSRGRPREIPESYLATLQDEVDRARESGREDCVAVVAKKNKLPLESLRRALRRLRNRD